MRALGSRAVMYYTNPDRRWWYWDCITIRTRTPAMRGVQGWNTVLPLDRATVSDLHG